MKTIIVAFMAFFLTTFSSEVKAQYMACTHSASEFVASVSCNGLCECTITFQIPVNLNPSLYSMEFWKNGTLQTTLGPVSITYTDRICFLLKHPNNDIEECCFSGSDFCN